MNAHQFNYPKTLVQLCALFITVFAIYILIFTPTIPMDSILLMFLSGFCALLTIAYGKLENRLTALEHEKAGK